MSLNKRDVFILASHRHEVTIGNLLLLLILLLLIIYRVLFSDRITCGRLVAGVLALTMLVAVAGSERGRRLQTHGVALGVQMANNTGARGFSGYGMPATGNQTPHESNITHDKRKAVGSKLTL